MTSARMQRKSMAVFGRSCARAAWPSLRSAPSAPSAGMRGVIIGVVAWSLAWKGAALWRAAKDDSKPWFIALLISNTAGVLDSVYLFGVSATRRRRARQGGGHPTDSREFDQPGSRQET